MVLHHIQQLVHIPQSQPSQTLKLFKDTNKAVSHPINANVIGPQDFIEAKIYMFPKAVERLKQGCLFLAKH